MKKKSGNKVIKMPQRTEDGMLEDVSDLFEQVRSNNVRDFLLIYTTKDAPEAVITAYSVIDAPAINMHLDILKLDLLLSQEEDNEYEDDDPEEDE